MKTPWIIYKTQYKATTRASQPFDKITRTPHTMHVKRPLLHLNVHSFEISCILVVWYIWWVVGSVLTNGHSSYRLSHKLKIALFSSQTMFSLALHKSCWDFTIKEACICGACFAISDRFYMRATLYLKQTFKLHITRYPNNKTSFVWENAQVLYRSINWLRFSPLGIFTTLEQSQGVTYGTVGLSRTFSYPFF